MVKEKNSRPDKDQRPTTSASFGRIAFALSGFPNSLHTLVLDFLKLLFGDPQQVTL